MSGLSKTFVDLKIQTRRIMVFAKSQDPDSLQVKRILDQYYLPPGTHSPSPIKSISSPPSVADSYEWVDIEKRQDCRQLENYLQFLSYTDRRQVSFGR